jgi:hypothetical protein
MRIKVVFSYPRLAAKSDWPGIFGLQRETGASGNYRF